jgi:hypothetical protein
VRRAAATGLAVLALLAALPAGAVLADSDPASDILLVQDAFYPYQPTTPAGSQKALEKALAEIRKAGLDLHVAIIAGPTDLGAVPTLFGQPQHYATYLESEIAFNHAVPLLVVMPQGFGIAKAGSASAVGGIAIGSGAVGLASAATQAVEKIAAARGTPIASVKVAKTAGGGSSGPPALLLFGVPIGLLLIGGGVLALRRPKGAAEDEAEIV